MIVDYKKYLKNEKFLYLIAGIYNTIFGYGIFVFTWYFFAENYHYILLLCIVHVLSVTNAYFSFRFFVWKKKIKFFSSYLRFNFVYIGGLLASIIFLPVATSLLNNAYIAKILIDGGIIIIRFFLNRSYVFRIKRK